MKRKILTSMLLLLTAIVSNGQTHNVTEAEQPQGKSIVFRFVAEDDTFYVPYQGNGDKLTELIATIDRYKSMISEGIATIDVAGYSSAYATAKENLRSASVRANRVKSELVVRNGIREENFKTTVHATPFEGRKSVVVVTLRVPQPEKREVAAPKDPEPQPSPQPKPEPKPEPKPKPEPLPAVEEATSVVMPVVAQHSYRLALRTNLLYDAFLVPNIGAEYRVGERLGIKVDGGGSSWGSSTGNVQKLWFVNPELRYYMGSTNRFYAGFGGNYAKYNVYKGMLGGLFSSDTGYQGTMWNAGIVAGYQLKLTRALSLDLNIGAGYNSFAYDSFSIINETRFYRERDKTTNRFGITQAGVSLVWKIVK